MKQIVPIAFVVMIAATAPHLSTVLAAAASARACRRFREGHAQLQRQGHR